MFRPKFYLKIRRAYIILRGNNRILLSVFLNSKADGCNGSYSSREVFDLSLVSRK